jgi:phosphoribosylformimino-5-aminoimidazole carboxamide ribotide isomerase
MRVVPAIDLIGGKCVRLTQGDYSQKQTYREDPLEVAQELEDAGLTHLHLVDLDGAKKGAVVNFEVLERIAKNTALLVDFGGGIKTEEEAQKSFDLGANQIVLGSLAVKQPELVAQWIAQFGLEKLVIGADTNKGMIAVAGWQEISQLPLAEFLNGYQSYGKPYILCTDIQKDGMMAGPASELYKELLGNYDIHLIASGGVRHVEDLQELAALGCESAIVGKAYYEGQITAQQMAKLNTL